MSRNRGPPQRKPRQGHSAKIFVDKLRALAVFSTHDEQHSRRSHDDLRGLQSQLPAVRNSSERPSPVPVPELQEDVHRGARAGSRLHVHQPRQSRSCPAIAARRQLDSQHGADYRHRPEHAHASAGAGRGALRNPDGVEDPKPHRA